MLQRKSGHGNLHENLTLLEVSEKHSGYKNSWLLGKALVFFPHLGLTQVLLVQSPSLMVK